MEQITRADLELVNKLSKRTFTGNQLLSNASIEEKEQLKEIKRKLKSLAVYFSEKYKTSYGPFETSVATGNDIAIGGTKFKRIWSGIFKGAENKQYAAQISFVFNEDEPCLDVGFYFGRASGHGRNKKERVRLEGQLKNLGLSLSNSIINNKDFRKKYLKLFDFGFSASAEGRTVPSQDWYNLISSKTKSSQIVAKIKPNDFNVIENSTIDSFVSLVIFLMGGISAENKLLKPKIKPLTPEQRAKQAERLAEIGNKGELYIMKKEQKKLSSLGLKSKKYPKHVALKSDSYGYDIASLDENGDKLLIEVKTTTRSKDDSLSKQFYLSSNEYKVYKANKSNYKIYRVYDIENSPSFEVLDLKNLDKRTDGYIFKY